MSIIPSSLYAKLKIGESVNETKTVSIPELPPKADVVFCFDLTGSMGGILATAKAKAIDIINNLNSLVGVNIQYGVTSHMDYPHCYNSYGYNACYGSGSDYAYMLNQSITVSSTDVTNAINSLSLGNGNDAPEDYTRVFYESYADAALGWREGAKRIFVHFGDNVPHDNNLNEGIFDEGGIWSTGGDPGRDEEMFTADDLDLQTVLNGMKDNNVILLECRTNDYAFDYWVYWSEITGGETFITASDTFVDDVTNAIESTLTTPIITNLHLETTPGYGAWLTSVIPPSYTGPTGVDVDFQITITVPPGTPDGDYYFDIIAKDSQNVEYGRQNVHIEVYSLLPPDVSGAYPSPQYLWPPNNKYVDVQILGVTDPNGGTIQISILGITSDEATATTPGAGGPKQAPDADPNCIGTSVAVVRAERSGLRNGRVYEITFKATNSAGLQAIGSVKVYVPLYANDTNVIDDGQYYDATKIN